MLDISVKRASRSPTSRDDGFTFIELLVAMSITMVAMFVLLGVFVSSLSTVTLAKQRQTATALATQVDGAAPCLALRDRDCGSQEQTT